MAWKISGGGRHGAILIGAAALLAAGVATAEAGRESQCARHARAAAEPYEDRSVDTALGAGVGLAGGLAVAGATSGVSAAAGALIGGGLGGLFGYHEGGAYFYHYREAYFDCMAR